MIMIWCESPWLQAFQKILADKLDARIATLLLVDLLLQKFLSKLGKFHRLR